MGNTFWPDAWSFGVSWSSANGLHRRLPLRHLRLLRVNYSTPPRVILLGSITIIVALGLSAIALLPTLELVSLTARTALSYAEASRYSLHPLAFSAFLNPNVLGRGARFLASH